MANMKELLKATAKKLNMSVEELIELSNAELERDKQEQRDIETKRLIQQTKPQHKGWRDDPDNRCRKHFKFGCTCGAITIKEFKRQHNV